MDEEFEMLIEEIKCCETDEDLRLVVENLSNYCENNFQL